MIRHRLSTTPVHEDLDFNGLAAAGAELAGAVSIVVVCFNSRRPLEKLLAGLARGAQGNFVQQIIIVNNSASDAAEIARIAKENRCDLVQNEANIGYGAACNVGAKLASGDLLLFLNPDVYVSTGSLAILVGAASRFKQGVAFGPALFDNGRRRRSKMASHADPRSRPKQMFDRSVGIDSTGFLSGCALMVRRDAFEKVGGFDENIFLYHEDDDLCIRLRDHGYLYRVHAAVALHSHGLSAADPLAWRPMRARALGWSAFYVMRKHRGAGGLIAASIKLGLRCLSPFNILSKRYRTKTVNMFTGALTALRGDCWSSLLREGFSS